MVWSGILLEMSSSPSTGVTKKIDFLVYEKLSYDLKLLYF